MGYHNYCPERNGEYRILAEVLQQCAVEPPIVFDVGANEGAFTARTQKLCPSAQVYAFEPNPPTYARLAARFADCDRVHVHALGLSASEAVLELADYAGASGSAHASFLAEGIAAVQPSLPGRSQPQLAFTRVAVVTLDSILARHEIRTIDLLKLDVEGHEHAVLLGAQDAIAQRRIRNVQIEVNVHNALTGSSLHRIAALLPGYQIYKILPDGLYRIELGALHDMFRYANFLFRAPGAGTRKATAGTPCRTRSTVEAADVVAPRSRTIAGATIDLLG